MIEKLKPLLITVAVMCISFNLVLSEQYDFKNSDQAIYIIHNNEQQIKLFMKCKVGMSCAFRINTSSTDKSYFQLDSIEGLPICILRDPAGFDDSSTASQYIIKSDGEYNYAFLDNIEINQDQNKGEQSVDISSVANESDRLYQNHFNNIYSQYMVKQMKNTSDIQEFDYFKGLSEINNSIQAPKQPFKQNEERKLQTTTTTYVITLVKKAHAIGLLVIWGFLVDISIICVRYFKAYKKYLRFHASVFAIGNICSLIIVFCQIAQRSSYVESISQQPSNEGAHFGMGVAMVTVITIQHLIGMVTKLNFENENGSQKVHYIKRVHKILGYLIYLLGKTNVLVGVDMFEKRYYPQSSSYNNWWAKVLGGIYVIQLIIIAAIEFAYRSEPEFLISKKRNTKEYIDLDKQAQHASIIKHLNEQAPISFINRMFPDILYVIHENSVYDISEIQHPGGQFILKHIKGKEISRYFNGGYACEQTTMAPYRHTLYAQNFLKQFFVGDLDSEYYNILVPNEEIKEIPGAPKNVWTSDEVQSINELYKVFQFANKYFKIKTHLSGVRWFGRSFVVTPQLDTVNIHSRNYSIVLAYMEENYKYRVELIRYFQNKLRDDEIRSQMSQIRSVRPPEPVKIGKRIPLLIKKEIRNTKSGLSKFMHLDIHKLYYMSEPVGYGLEINELSDGEHIIFAAGTGILPFLDLFDYLLKKLIYLEIKARFGEREAELVNPYNEKYEEVFGPDFRVKLFGAFTSKAECYGYQIISDLHVFCREFNYPFFQAKIRFSNQESDQFLLTTKSRFDSKFIDDELQQTFPTKFLICGPPEFNKNIYNILTAVRGIDEQRVQIV